MPEANNMKQNKPEEWEERFDKKFSRSKETYHIGSGTNSGSEEIKNFISEQIKEAEERGFKKAENDYVDLIRKKGWWKAFEIALDEEFAGGEERCIRAELWWEAHGKKEKKKAVKEAIQQEKQRLVREIDKLITIHTQLSKEIIGNNDYHIGAIRVLGNLKITLNN